MKGQDDEEGLIQTGVLKNRARHAKHFRTCRRQSFWMQREIGSEEFNKLQLLLLVVVVSGCSAQKPSFNYIYIRRRYYSHDNDIAGGQNSWPMR